MNKETNAGTVAGSSTTAQVTTSSQPCTKPNVICSASTKVFGERKFWDCPFCETHTQDFGDKNNPSGIVVGEMICTSCRNKIKNLIGL